jgi:PhnB protein
MQVQPYLFFEGRCRDALEFYKKTLGAEVIMSMKYSESPDVDAKACGDIPGDAIMHCSFKIGDSTVMASDGRASGKTNFDGFSLSITPNTEEKARRMFADLSDGGKVTMPLAKTFFSPAFGMLQDKFGVHWMIYVEGQQK